MTRLNDARRPAPFRGDQSGAADRIAGLLRCAVEAEQLDGGSFEADTLLHAARRARRQRMLGIATGLCVAACLAVAGLRSILTIGPELLSSAPERELAQAPDGQPSNGPANTPAVSVGRGPIAPLVQHQPSVIEDQCCVVIALVRDTSGELRCVRWRQSDLAQCGVDRMNVLDLKTAVQPSHCVPSGEQVVLVAVSGPTRSLPSSDQSATELAQCILGTPRLCELEAHCFEPGAARCLPPDVSVRIEAVTMYN
jgi:hypothetical protein